MDVSLVVSLVSVAATVLIGMAAIWIACRLSKRAEESLRKSTEIVALSAAQVLRRLHYSSLPDPQEIYDLGVDYWGLTQTAHRLKPDGTVELVATQGATGSTPLYTPEGKITDPEWIVSTPSGKTLKATVPHERLSDRKYTWRVNYPKDFAGANSVLEQGLYGRLLC